MKIELNDSHKDKKWFLEECKFIGIQNVTSTLQ